MVGVVVQQPLGQVEHRGDPGVGQLVVDDPVLAAGGDEPAPAQAGQVVGDLGLGLAEPAGQVTGGQFSLGLEQPEDAQAGWVAQGAEVLGDQVGVGIAVSELASKPGRDAGWARSDAKKAAAHGLLLTERLSRAYNHRARARTLRGDALGI